jgi:hypothetical protein
MSGTSASLAVSSALLPSVRVPARAVRILLAMLFGLVVVFGGVFGAAGAASAHGGPFQLDVAPDGAGGVVVSAAYIADHHAVTEIIDPVATAVSPDGTTVGPVPLISSAEGEGLWVSAEPFLPEGQWAVTVATTLPSSATVTVDMTVTALAAPIEPGETIASTADAAAASGSALTMWLWIAAIAVALSVLAAVVIRALRRVPATPAS